MHSYTTPRISNTVFFLYRWGVIAELERNLIAERVKEGLEASKKRGKKLGRPKVDKDKVTLAQRMYDSKEYSVKEIIEGTGISQGSLYRAIQKRTLETT